MAPVKNAPAFVGPISPVIPYISHWSDAALLVPHEPIREDLARMERLLQPHYFDGTKPWKVAAFFKWYNDWFYPNVHHHHDIEETIFFPALVARCGSIPERMSEDHASLMRMLDEIRGMEPRFEPQTLGIPSAPHQRLAAEELRQLVAHLAAELRDHLNEEERFFTPVVKAHFTKKEHQELVDRIVKAGGLTGNAKLAPWVAHSMYKWAGADYVEKEFLAGLPGVVRFLFDHFWYPAYLKKGVRGLNVLELEADPKTSAGKSLRRIASISSQ